MPGIKYFLSANSPEGFVSYHEAWLDGWDTVFLLKGGPGGGKSTFMRRVQRHMEARGLPCEEVYCATDPSSLDGLGIPALGAALFDATPPHAADPRYFGSKDVYLSLGEYCDTAPLKAKWHHIAGLTDRYRAMFPRITRCLSGAKSMSDQRFDLVLRGVPLDQLTSAAAALIQQAGLDGQADKAGSVRARFLSARDRDGVRFLDETVRWLTPRRFILQDTYGLSPFVLAPILRAATAAGHDVWACYDPQSPRHLLRHVLLPELGFGFVCRTGDSQRDEGVSLSLDAMVDPNLLAAKATRLGLLEQVESSRLQDASRLMKDARAIHDELEALYRPHLDFEGLTSSADALASRLLDAGL
jgi:hypothetical protein